jgi:hypothetical protein
VGLVVGGRADDPNCDPSENGSGQEADERFDETDAVERRRVTRSIR